MPKSGHVSCIMSCMRYRKSLRTLQMQVLCGFADFYFFYLYLPFSTLMHPFASKYASKITAVMRCNKCNWWIKKKANQTRFAFFYTNSLSSFRLYPSRIFAIIFQFLPNTDPQYTIAPRGTNYFFSSSYHISHHKVFNDFLGSRQKEICHPSNKKCADDRTYSPDTTEYRSNQHKRKVCHYANKSKSKMCFFADCNRHQVIRSGSCLWLDNDGHAGRKDRTTQCQNKDLNISLKGYQRAFKNVNILS